MVRLGPIRECSGMICKANGETPPNSSIIWRHHASWAKKAKVLGRCMGRNRNCAWRYRASQCCIFHQPLQSICFQRLLVHRCHRSFELDTSDTKNPFQVGSLQSRRMLRFGLFRIPQRGSRWAPLSQNACSGEWRRIHNLRRGGKWETPGRYVLINLQPLHSLFFLFFHEHIDVIMRMGLLAPFKFVLMYSLPVWKCAQPMQ